MNSTEVCGRLVWFSLAGVEVRHDTVATAVADLGLPLQLVPRQPTAAEAFRRTCRETRLNYRLPDGLYAEIRVKGLGSVQGRLHRQLVRTITPARGAAIYHDVVGEATFIFAGTDGSRRRAATGEKLQLRLDTDRLADYERPLLEQLCQRFTERYGFCRDHVSGGAARDMVRGLLEEAKALRCSPSGGLYFLPVAGVPALRHIERLCERLDILLRSVPLADAAEVRTTLAATLADQAVHQAQLLADSLAATIATDGKLQPSVRQRFGARAELLVASLDHHAQLLEVELPEVAVDLLATALERLAATE